MLLASSASRSSISDTATRWSGRYGDGNARLIGLPGTLKTKGCNRPERPLSRVTLDGIGTSTWTDRHGGSPELWIVSQERPVREPATVALAWPHSTIAGLADREPSTQTDFLACAIITPLTSPKRSDHPGQDRSWPQAHGKITSRSHIPARSGPRASRALSALPLPRGFPSRR